MGMSFKGMFGKMEEASVKRVQLVEEKKIAPAGEVRIAMDAKIAEERKIGLQASKQTGIIEGYEHSGKYWKREGGTLTQTHPGLMNPTEFMMWKRKQAGLSTRVVAPGQSAEDEAAIVKTFGVPIKQVARPVVTPTQIRESAEETKAIAYKAAVGRSTKVEAHEYIAHHAQHFGTTEAASLGAGLHNLYSDEYDVLTPKEGVNVVVDSRRDSVSVISDKPLSEAEKLSYRRTVDKAGDVPNQVRFIESGGSEAVTSGGGALPGAGTSMLLLLVAIVAAAWLLLRGK